MCTAHVHVSVLLVSMLSGNEEIVFALFHQTTVLHCIVKSVPFFELIY